MLIYMVEVGGRWHFGGGNGRALIMFWMVLTVGAIMAASLGYIVRSTAATITVSMLLLFVSQAIVIINLDWVRETLIHFMPVNIMSAATSTELWNSVSGGQGLSGSQAGIVWVVFAVVVGILGLVRYQRSDI